MTIDKRRSMAGLLAAHGLRLSATPRAPTTTPGDDEIIGTDGRDIIAALQGNDIICGGQGNDVIEGGPGFDTLFGAQGNDVIYSAQARGQTANEILDDSRGAHLTSTEPAAPLLPWSDPLFG